MSNRPLLARVLGRPLPAVAVLDIGAMFEDQDRYDVLVEQGLARVTGFEPNAAKRAELDARSGPYRYLPDVLGDGGPGTLHLAHYPGCTSLLEPDPAVIDLFTAIGTDPEGGRNFAVVDTVAVQTRRLDDVGVESPDLLKIDIQGAELAVLRNGTRVLESVLVLESEVEFVPLYREQPLFGDLQVFARDQGLVLHKLVDVSGRAFRPVQLANPHAPVSQLLWADAVFVRDFTRLERYDDEELLKAALILNDVYRSFDLVHLLLAEHDRRDGGELAPVFAQALAQAESLDPLFLNVK